MKNTPPQGNWTSRMRLAGAGARLALATALVSAVITIHSAQAQTLTTLHSFDSTDGAVPYAGLVQATDGNFYGTTENLRANGDGTVFNITPSGTLTTLHSFGSTDGRPFGALIQATDGDFYGTTLGGGASGDGTVFKMTASGTLTALHSFDATDGSVPSAVLVQATNGNFYGTTSAGGANGYGTVFKITPSGTLTTLHSFNGTDGSAPWAGLVQATNRDFYGTAWTGGAHGDGTVFKITPSGTLTTLYSFCSLTSCADGDLPYAGLVQATDGDFYGTTYFGGTAGDGTVFKITPSGTLTTLYSFCSQPGCTDGGWVVAGLMQATNGDFYGTATEGGASHGTVFSLSVGLRPFLKIQSASGKEGVKIGMLGQGFDSSSVVKFEGVAAKTIAVTGSAYISATVPAGALTGPVTVTSGATTLTSPQTFKVLPTITGFTPSSGTVGTPVTVTGTGLTQGTKLTFGGVKVTSFTVNNDTQVTADVPTGAKTGKVAVTTNGGSATSKTSFTVN